MSNIEEWRPIIGFDGYEISNLGRARSSRTGKLSRLISGTIVANGYRALCLRRDGVNTWLRTSRVVAMAFIGKPPFEGAVVDHINSDRLDNRVENLRYLSSKENVLIGTGPTAINHRKTACHSGHAFTLENTGLKASGKRSCRACQKIYIKNWRMRRVANRGRE